MLENNIMIVTDEATNAIIVRANSQDYAKIRETIQRLDIIPRQVLIEVFIGEVGLSGDTQFGVEWALLQNNDKLGGYKGSSKIGQNFGDAGLLMHWIRPKPPATGLPICFNPIACRHS